MIQLFHAIGYFYYRPLWDEEIKKVEEIGHYLPRIGMKCCLLKADGKEAIIRSNSYLYQQDRIEFSAMDENTGYSTIFVLEKIENNKTRLTLQFLIRKHLLGEMLFHIIHKRTSRSFCTSLCYGKMVVFLLLMNRGKAAQLRYFLLKPDYRGIGLGKQMLNLYMDFLKECHYQ